MARFPKRWIARWHDEVGLSDFYALVDGELWRGGWMFSGGRWEFEWGKVESPTPEEREIQKALERGDWERAKRFGVALWTDEFARIDPKTAEFRPIRGENEEWQERVREEESLWRTPRDGKAEQVMQDFYEGLRSRAPLKRFPFPERWVLHLCAKGDDVQEIEVYAVMDGELWWFRGLDERKHGKYGFRWEFEKVEPPVSYENRIQEALANRDYKKAIDTLVAKRMIGHPLVEVEERTGEFRPTEHARARFEDMARKLIEEHEWKEFPESLWKDLWKEWLEHKLREERSLCFSPANPLPSSLAWIKEDLYESVLKGLTHPRNTCGPERNRQVSPFRSR